MVGGASNAQLSDGVILSTSQLVTVRQSAEYKAALELELWKEIKEQEFLATLRKKEEMLLSEYSSAFKQEQADLESEVRTSKRLYDQQMKQYKDKLSSLDKRGKKYAQNESSFERTCTSFVKERSAKLDDVKQKSNFRKDFLNFELETLINKINDTQCVNDRLARRLEDTERAIQNKEIEFQNSTNFNYEQIPIKLQEELFDTKIQFTSAKDRLSRVTIAKERYKLKLKSLLEELSSSHRVLLPSHTEDAKETAVTTAVKETVVTNPAQSSATSLKCELRDILSRMSTIEQQSATPITSGTDSDVAKLICERNTLLNTGVYSSHDFIIQQIDNKIKALLELKEKSSPNRL